MRETRAGFPRDRNAIAEMLGARTSDASVIRAARSGMQNPAIKTGSPGLIRPAQAIFALSGQLRYERAERTREHCRAKMRPEYKWRSGDEDGRSSELLRSPRWKAIDEPQSTVHNVRCTLP